MSYLHGGRIVAKALREQGVSHLFTLCGGHIQAIYDGCLDEEIRVIDVRHEQTAAHAADGWARVTGVPGVAAVTAGPGVTDAITAVANAYRAQVPMILIGGQGARAYGALGGQDRGALQELNHVELLRPITKWSVSVPETKRLAEYVQSAFRVAQSGVPGPVFLEMPLDVLMNGCASADIVQYPNSKTSARAAADPVFVEKAVALIKQAERPLLIVGSQWRWSADPDALQAFTQVAPMPTFLNGLARGALSRQHAGLFSQCRAKALALADLVVLFGTPLDFRMGYGEKIPPQCKLIQVDLDGAEIGRNRSVDVGVVGDTGHVMRQFAHALQGSSLPKTTSWMRQVAEFEQGNIAKLEPELTSNAVPINPLRLCHELNQFIDGKTIVIGDGGDFVATAAYTLGVEGAGSWMDPGPLGTLGVGPGYAMAAKLARPDHRVVMIMGDGSFGLHAMEFEAMVRQGISVVAIIGNDACWTQIYRGQTMMYGRDRTVATRLDYTRYDQVVTALGGHGEYVEQVADLTPALKRAFAANKASVVNVKIGSSDFRKNAISV